MLFRFLHLYPLFFFFRLGSCSIGDCKSKRGKILCCNIKYFLYETPGRFNLLGAFLLFGGFLLPHTIFFLSLPFSVDFCAPSSKSMQTSPMLFALRRKAKKIKFGGAKHNEKGYLLNYKVR